MEGPHAAWNPLTLTPVTSSQTLMFFTFTLGLWNPSDDS